MNQIIRISDRQPLPVELQLVLARLDVVLVELQPKAALIQQVKEVNPQLILLDQDASVPFSCFEICKQLKNNPDTENIPIIVLYQQALESAVVVALLESGAHDCISLTGDLQEIGARIQATLRFKQSIKQFEVLTSQLRELNTELYERNHQVEKELYTARQLQQSLLPPFLPDPATENLPTDDVGEFLKSIEEVHFSKCHYRDDKLQVSGIYLPCDTLGGDLYDIIPFSDQTLGVTVADVSGHGVPASFITAIFKASFYRITHNYSDPSDILYHLNNELGDLIKTGDYITSIYCRIHRETLSMDYTGAGHPYPVYYQAATGTLTRLTENGTPLVWMKNMDYPMGNITLAPGDKILIFTDGISEIKNIHHEMFGEPALEALFLQLIEAHPTRILDKMFETLSDFTQGHPLEDDMSLVLIEAK